MARPSTYNERFHPKLVLSYARRGLTNYQIAEKLGIARSTLNEWIKQYPELSDALLDGRGLVISEIESSLVKRSKGYEVEETKIIGIPETVLEDGEEKERLRPIRVEKTKRHIPPSEGAAKLLLNAWLPEVYHERTEVGGLDGNPIQVQLIRDPSNKPKDQPRD